MLNDLNCVSCIRLRQKFEYYTSNMVSKQYTFFIIRLHIHASYDPFYWSEWQILLGNNGGAG